MIKNYRDKMGGLVSSGTKIQMTPNYRDEKHILPIRIMPRGGTSYFEVKRKNYKF